jgi:hypothetical protein
MEVKYRGVQDAQGLKSGWFGIGSVFMDAWVRDSIIYDHDTL